jgi:TetR/AcrR family transcriptional repressor of nem operon
MARPREFDLDAALEQAMNLLWTKGYKATSLDELCAATGLSRSSFYAAFGSKRDLLLRTVERYVEQRSPSLIAILARPISVQDAFGALLDESIDQIVAGSGRRGCFLGNCAAELPRSDRSALAQVREGLGRTETIFREALIRGRARGELEPQADVNALARFLVAGIQGLRLVGKVNPDRAALKDVASTLLRCLH